MFRELNEEEQEKFRAWARANYAPGSVISELWHPVLRAECEAMNAEQTAKKAAEEARVQRDTELSRGFDRGNYANAYETEDYDQALEALEDVSSDYRAAFTLGFFSSYEPNEVPESAEASYWEAALSEAGKRVFELGYTEKPCICSEADGYWCLLCEREEQS